MVLLELRVKNTSSRVSMAVTSDHLTKLPLDEGEPTDAEDHDNFLRYGQNLGEPAVGRRSELSWESLVPDQERPDLTWDLSVLQATKLRF